MFWKHHECLNVTNIRSLNVNVRVLWTDLGGLFSLCSSLPETHLKSSDPRATVSVEESFAYKRIQLALDVIIHWDSAVAARLGCPYSSPSLLLSEDITGHELSHIHLFGLLLIH